MMGQPQRADGRDQPLTNAGESFPTNDAASASSQPRLPARKGCFPLHLFSWAPPACRMFIPGTWQVIQDTTHLSLAIGVICLTFMGVIEIIEVTAGNAWRDIFFKFVCIVLLLVLIFVYILRIVGQYDQAIVEREKSIKEQRQNLISGYEDLVQDIDGMLNRATESTQSLAENEFNGKRRDFLRFLERMEDRFDSSTQAVTEQERAATFASFKKFCIMWLKLYEECSLDPINRPFRIADPAQIELKRTIPELCKELKKEVEEKGQVYFSRQIDEGKKDIKQKRQTIKRLSVPLLPLTWNPDSGGPVPGSSEIELSSNLRFRPENADSDSDGDVEAPPRHGASGREVRPPKKPPTKLPCSWIKVGKAGCGPCCCGGSTGSPPFPRRCGCLCGEVVLLSPEHIKLLLGLCVAVVLVFGLVGQLLKLGLPKDFDSHYALLLILPSAGVVQAILFMLSFFEQIDIIQRMEQELTQLKVESDDLHKKKEEMVQYWEQVQAITDIWVHRVTPRLFLYKEVHACLEDLRKPAEFLKGMQNANQGLEALENRLPALAHWRADGNISQADKKRFDETLKHISNHAEDLQTVVNNLNKICASQNAIPSG